MTAFTLLMICVGAQILIAGALGIYLFRTFRKRKEEEKNKKLTAEDAEKN